MAVTIGNRQKARAAASVSGQPAAPVATGPSIADLQARLAAAERERDAALAKVASAQRPTGLTLGVGAKGTVTFNMVNANGQTVGRGWLHRAACESFVESFGEGLAAWDAIPSADRARMVAESAERSAAFKARTTR